MQSRGAARRAAYARDLRAAEHRRRGRAACIPRGGPAQGTGLAGRAAGRAGRLLRPCRVVRQYQHAGGSAALPAPGDSFDVSTPLEMPPVIGFAAWSGTGKTTLLAALLPLLRA